jgi:hypothetical protein
MNSPFLLGITFEPIKKKGVTTKIIERKNSKNHHNNLHP